jgi:hypothetical protein
LDQLLIIQTDLKLILELDIVPLSKFIALEERLQDMPNNDDLTPEELKEQDALQRILERFVLYAQKQIGENFQHSPEAQFNKNLFPETVYDMTMAAQIYQKIFNANIYEQVQFRTRGVREFMQTNLTPPRTVSAPSISTDQDPFNAFSNQPSLFPLNAPQPVAPPQPTAGPPSGDMTLLEALSAYGSAATTPQAPPATNPDGSPNLTQPLSPEQIAAIKEQGSGGKSPLPQQQPFIAGASGGGSSGNLVVNVDYDKDGKPSIRIPSTSFSPTLEKESEISRLMKHNAGLVTK